jgi:uncharacterized DUF497 family protein
MINFKWDDEKARSNERKHGITFDEAKSAFYDDCAKVINDDVHSDDEDRFILLGLSSKLRVLVVIHCYRENEEIIRLISARKATKSEIHQYEGYKP